MQSELQVLKPKLLITSENTEKLMVNIEQNTMNIEAAKEVITKFLWQFSYIINIRLDLNIDFSEFEIIFQQ